MKKYLSLFFLVNVTMLCASEQNSLSFCKPGSSQEDKRLFTTNNFGQKMHSFYNQTVDTIKSDLNIGKPDVQSDTNHPNSFFDNAVKTCRVVTYCIAARYCVGILTANIFPAPPGSKQFESVTNSFLLYGIMVAPIWEECIFTYGAQKIMGNYSRICAPLLFGIIHYSPAYDKNYLIQVLAATATVNFVHQQVAHREPKAELPVVIMSHMLQNMAGFGWNKYHGFY